MRFGFRAPDIPTRLALWFMLIMGLALGAFSYAVYQLTLDSLRQQMETDVRQRATSIAAAQPGLVQTSPPVLNTDAFSTPDVFVEILGPTGTVLSRSSNLGNTSLPFRPSAIQSNRVEELRVGGQPVFLCGRAVRVHGQLMGYILVAESPSSIYQAVHRLRAILIPGVPIALVLAGLAGWLLIWHSMRPLGRLSRAAERIAVAQDHTQRVGFAGPGDEIGRLAASIDSMLEALEAAHRQLAMMNASQRQFLADISHELRTPLTIMLSTLDILNKAGAGDAEFHKNALAEMRIEAGRMARMVTQLLTMARSESGSAMAKQPILISDVVAEACRQVQLNGSGVSLDSNRLEAVEDVVVEGDEDYLKQLFMILVDNAVKYTREGGRVAIMGEVGEKEVSVTVADSGIGIPPEDLDRVFDRFFRSENARFKDGLGLGLSIAKGIAGLHGGRIDASSAPGRGSEFTVRLPLSSHSH